MSKDPAFLFYSSDFLIGTADLTMEEKGMFITLMCLQHQKGRLSKKTIWLSLGFYLVIKFEDFELNNFISESVLKKFQIDEKGNYYNARLENVIIERAEFINSRRQNGAKGGRPKKTKENLDKNLNETYKKAKKNLHENEDENENINEIIDSLDIFTAQEIQKVFEIYKKNCPDLIHIGYERNKRDFLVQIKEFLRVIRLDFDYLEKVCIKANKLKIIANNKIDLKSVMNNHEGIYNDKYPFQEQEKSTDGQPALNWSV